MYVVLAGGVGGSRFVRSLLAVVPPEEVTVIVNTGDDIERFGLHISPDIDTNLYTLSGRLDEERGWGRSGESWHGQDLLRTDFGVDTWFNLGDLDLATHLYRTGRMRSGASLSTVTAEMAQSFGLRCRVLPMTDDSLATYLETEEGTMHFQEYLIRRRCEPRVRAVRFQGLEQSKPAPGVLEAIAGAKAILIPPSNPVVSVGPILALRGVRETIASASAPVVAVSPIIGGKTVKGPADRMLGDLGWEASAAGVAAWYGEILDGFVADHADAGLQLNGVPVRITDTWMSTPEQRRALATTTVSFAAELAGESWRSAK
jgi:LPPG:FO 2-phospho-L-lactate transferase